MILHLRLLYTTHLSRTPSINPIVVQKSKVPKSASSQVSTDPLRLKHRQMYSSELIVIHLVS